MEAWQPHLDDLAPHLLTIVFASSLVEATGVPFPSRIILIVAATLTSSPGGLLGLMLAAIAGSLIGDHGPFLAGRAMGPRLLAVYCRLTLGSERCVEKTIDYFRRFGAGAVMLGRFVTSVRLFSAVLSGCGHLSYRQFVTYDLLGTMVYAVLWVTIGHLVGEQVGDLLARHRSARLLVLVVPVACVGLFTYRLVRRLRYGPARATAVESGSACVEADRLPR
jgi:membrane protein DedA with SNARE-associated domain